MCGRFLLANPNDAIYDLFDVNDLPELKPRYNLAPTQTVPAIRIQPGDEAISLCHLRWGLIPSWAKDAKIGSRMINARSETAASKPSFRTAFKRRRCLIPADGYYEWAKQAGGPKQPYLIHLPERQPFAMAGLWERWIDRNEEPIESFTILTTDANESVEALHNRMPVIMPRENFIEWLDPSVLDSKRVESLLTYSPQLEAFPVGAQVNNVRNDDPSCIEPVEQMTINLTTVEE